MSSATTVQASSTSLTSHDATILQVLFDAEMSTQSGGEDTIESTVDKNTNNPRQLLPRISPRQYTELKAAELDALAPLSASASPTQDGIRSSIDELSKLITSAPDYIPAYVNRAQAVRILLQQDGDSDDDGKIQNDLFTNPENADSIALIFSDLNQAIKLSSPSPPSSSSSSSSSYMTTTSSISDLQSSLLATAHTHRGYLLLKASKHINSNPSSCVLPGPLLQMSKEELEEAAHRDFHRGGQYGNHIAKQMAVRTNPYAKMCGAIVKEALKKERGGF